MEDKSNMIGNGIPAEREKITLSELHDMALEYDLDIHETVEEIIECRVKMYKKRDKGILKSAIPLMDRLIYEAEEYKRWLEEQRI